MGWRVSPYCRHFGLFVGAWKKFYWYNGINDKTTLCLFFFLQKTFKKHISYGQICWTHSVQCTIQCQKSSCTQNRRACLLLSLKNVLYWRTLEIPCWSHRLLRALSPSLLYCTAQRSWRDFWEYALLWAQCWELRSHMHTMLRQKKGSMLHRTSSSVTEPQRTAMLPWMTLNG